MRELKGNWKDIFRLFRVALHIPKLFLGACGVAATLLTVGLYTVFWGQRIAGTTFFGFLENLGFPPEHSNYFLRSILLVPYRATMYIIYTTDIGSVQFLLWAIGSILLLILIWSYFGNAIARIAAFELTRDERIELGEACSYAAEKYGANFMSFMLPVIGFAFFWIVVWIVALLTNIPYLSAVVMLGLPLALLGGFIMVLILLGTTTGFPLFFPSIAVEGTDSFDAISRGFSYVLSRAWHYIWFWLLALVYGSICTVFVWAFAYLMIVTVNSAGHLAAGSTFENILNLEFQLTEQASLSTQITAGVYYFWIILFQLMAFAYACSYFFSSSTLIYLLMRKKVDGIDMEEIYEELGEEEEIFYEEPPIEEEDLDELSEEEEEKEEPEETDTEDAEESNETDESTEEKEEENDDDGESSNGEDSEEDPGEETEQDEDDTEKKES